MTRLTVRWFVAITFGLIVALALTSTRRHGQDYDQW